MKKYLLTLLSFLSSLFILKAQGSWSPRASLPDSARGYGIGFSIGNYGYAGLGGRIDSYWEYYNDFWQFDPSTNKWTRKADFPGKARICPTAFVIGKYAYIVCGAQNNEGYDLQTECWQYNSVTDQWKRKRDFPGLSRYCAVGFSVGKNGYLGTGYDTLPSPSPVLRDFWEYDTATDIWTQKHNFGGIARYGASGFAVGGKGYICFGVDSAPSPFYLSTANDIWEYDTGSDSWTQKSNNPKDFLALASGFVIGNNIYVGTGETYSPVRGFTDFWQYNTLTDTWTQQASFIGGEKAVCSAFSISDTGYLGLGIYDTSFLGTNTMYRFFIDSTLGISRIERSQITITTYPNPTNKFLNISTQGLHTGLATLSIMDIARREVINSQLTIDNSQLTIDVSKLSSGMYFINLKTKDLYATQKFIKQ